MVSKRDENDKLIEKLSADPQKLMNQVKYTIVLE
jgi:hypothetical protein